MCPFSCFMATTLGSFLVVLSFGQGLVILILGTFYSVGLGLVGLPFGVAIGALAASLSFIPYVGVLIGGATAIGVALFSFWGDPLWIGLVIAIFAIGQIVDLFLINSMVKEVNEEIAQGE